MLSSIHSKFLDRNFVLFFIYTAFIALFSQAYHSPAEAKGKIYINIGKANIKKSLAALPPFQYYGNKANKTNLRVGQDLFNITTNDLNVSGYFTFIKQSAFLEDTSKVGLRPAPGEANGFKFSSWKTIGTEFLIRCGYKIINNKVSLEAYVYYVPQAKIVFGKVYEGPITSVRKIAHSFTDDIIEKLTGKKGIFNSKIVVTSTHGGLKQKSIFTMDWDGKNIKKISNLNVVHLSPAWSHDGKSIAYTAYAYHKSVKTRNADLFMYNTVSNQRWLVSYRKGINSGAAFLPDGSGMLVTLSRGGSPDIFKMSLDGKRLTRLTKGPNHAMNVEPAISSDGKKIAFSSERSGRPMIYTMNSDGSSVKRITIAGKYNATPAWSPDGSKIAFAGFDKSHFDIFIMNPDGSGMERLTSAKKSNGRWADNEGPSFSPDGRHIMFTSNRSGHQQLYLINIDGSNERRITFDNYEYTQPKWSPYLK